jgi:DNA repair exonuclease SbcCD ATPase subunit
MSRNQGEVTSKRNDVTAAQSQMSTLQAEATSLNSELTSLQAQLNQALRYGARPDDLARIRDEIKDKYNQINYNGQLRNDVATNINNLNTEINSLNTEYQNLTQEQTSLNNQLANGTKEVNVTAERMSEMDANLNALERAAGCNYANSHRTTDVKVRTWMDSFQTTQKANSDLAPFANPITDAGSALNAGKAASNESTRLTYDTNYQARQKAKDVHRQQTNAPRPGGGRRP